MTIFGVDKATFSELDLPRFAEGFLAQSLDAQKGRNFFQVWPGYTVNTVQSVLDVKESMDVRNAKYEDARTARNAKECMNKSENGQSEVGSVRTDDMYRNAKNGQSGLKARSLTVNRCKTNFTHTTGGPYIERGRIDASDVTGQSREMKLKEGRGEKTNIKTRTKTSNNIRTANKKNNSGRTILPTDSTPVKRKLVEENNVRSLISRFENLTLSDPRRG